MRIVLFVLGMFMIMGGLAASALTGVTFIIAGAVFVGAGATITAIEELRTAVTALHAAILDQQRATDRSKT